MTDPRPEETGSDLREADLARAIWNAVEQAVVARIDTPEDARRLARWLYARDEVPAPSPDAQRGREPSETALQAAKVAADDTAQCECAMTDGMSCFFRLDLPGQKALCLKAALTAAYAVDFPDLSPSSPKGGV